MKYLFLYVLLIGFSSAVAQEYKPGTLVTSNDEILEGYIRSDFDINADKIYFKAEGEETPRTFDPENLDRISFKVRNSVEIVFVKQPVYEAFSKVSSPVWLQELIKGPVSLYAASGEGYALFCNGNFMELDQDITFYIKRSDEEAASLGAVYEKSAFSVNADRHFRKLTADYLSDYAGLSERIREREFGVLELPLVVELYNRWKRTGENL